MTLISENQLVLPALFLMDLSPTKGLTTAELIPKLRELLKPSGEDLELLDNRSDDHFSQKVRNLKSHNTFEKYGYAIYNNKIVTITQVGKEFLIENMDKLNYLLINDFKWDDLKHGLEIVQSTSSKQRKIEVFDELTVQEGVKKFVENEVFVRSSKLREIAIEHYTKNDDIFCDTCNFSFKQFYGDYGKGYIEIHHIKPIFKYGDEELEKTISDALNNVLPLCSNCHRIIHRNWRNPLEISQLNEMINKNGIYNRI